MLVDTPVPTTPQEDYMKTNSRKLDFVIDKSTPLKSTPSQAITSQVSSSMRMLPCVVKQGKQSIQIYAAKSATAPDDKHFWKMLADRLKIYRPLFTDKVFGTRVLEERDHCHLELAGHLIPNLLKAAIPRYILSIDDF